MHSILSYIKNHKLIVLLTLLGPLFYSTWQYHDYYKKVLAQQQVNTYLESELFRLEEKLDPIRELASLKAMLLARMDIVTTLAIENDNKFKLFALLSAIPDGVSLRSITAEESEVRIDGVANRTKSLEQFIGLINQSEICESGKVYPKPGKEPGSFSIYCYLGYGYYDEF